MESNFNEEKSGISLFINTEIRTYLRETSKWAKILAIIGFVGIGLMLVLSLFMLFGMSAIAGMFKTLPLSLMGIMYIVIAILYYFPVNYLNTFANKTKAAVALDSQDDLNVSFRNLKSLFKFIGIFSIIVISLYALIIVVMIPAAIISGFSSIF